ncbi:MAG: FtsX-like permease family protein [Chloroflexota bacterium]|nr:FtsX-like permease family protein [Chloroflexota bacterium]
MIFKNLLRRKGRTFLTVLGISIGVAAIVALGALADGIQAGYDSFLTGSQADLVLSQPDAMDVSLSAVDESMGAELATMSEVSEVSGMLQGMVKTENIPYFFIFGYPEDSFILNRFKIVAGVPLDSREAQHSHGKPLLLGATAAESLDKKTGDTIRLTDSVFRIVGIYETGQTMEDSGAILGMKDAQELLGRPRKVSVFYVRLKDQSLAGRLEERAERLWPHLLLSSTEAYADKQIIGNYMQGYVWAIAGLAIVIGGVGMMNAQLMSVMERTREIGVLRSVGWKRWRIMRMIIGESLLLGLLGGVIGLGLGWLMLAATSDYTSFFGTTTANISPAIIKQAAITVVALGLVGGTYPAWRASRLLPVEALRYEGGSAGKVRRLPIGGMAIQSLWQRTSRTLLALGAIGITVGGIMALEAVVRGMTDVIGGMGGDAEIMIRQAGIADTGYSTIDERIGDKIAVLPEVQNVSGMAFTATVLPDAGAFFILQGLAPNEYRIQRLNVVEGKRLTSNHQILLGRMMAEAMSKNVGDIIEISASRFSVIGIFESSSSWMEMGGVITLRDAQTFAGKPRKVGMYMVKVHDPSQAEAIVEMINTNFPEVHAALTGEFAEQMPDMESMDAMMAAISFLAIFVGGVGVMNTMLMAVLERTREIGVLRALGWRRYRILSMIMKESALLGLFGGVTGIGVAFGLGYLFSHAPMIGSMLTPVWELDIFVRAIIIALILGLLGGIYPALRATRLQPVEALRYE